MQEYIYYAQPLGRGFLPPQCGTPQDTAMGDIELVPGVRCMEPPCWGICFELCCFRILNGVAALVIRSDLKGAGIDSIYLLSVRSVRYICFRFDRFGSIGSDGSMANFSVIGSQRLGSTRFGSYGSGSCGSTVRLLTTANSLRPIQNLAFSCGGSRGKSPQNAFSCCGAIAQDRKRCFTSKYCIIFHLACVCTGELVVWSCLAHSCDRRANPVMCLHVARPGGLPF